MEDLKEERAEMLKRFVDILEKIPLNEWKRCVYKNKNGKASSQFECIHKNLRVCVPSRAATYINVGESKLYVRLGAEEERVEELKKLLDEYLSTISEEGAMALIAGVI